MDADFIRELGVLGVFVLLYMVGSTLLIRGHKADLSAVQNPSNATRRAATSATGGAPVRLNRRRKARLREAIERGEVEAEGQSTGDELKDED